MYILDGDFLLFRRLSCYDFPCQTQYRLVNIVKYKLTLLFTRAAMSNPLPTGRMWPTRRFCAAQFRFLL